DEISKVGSSPAPSTIFCDRLRSEAICADSLTSSKQVEPIRSRANIRHLRTIKLNQRPVSTCPAKRKLFQTGDTHPRSNPSERIDNWVANTRYQRQRGRGEEDRVFSKVRHAACSPWQVRTGLQIASSAHGTAPNFSIRID